MRRNLKTVAAASALVAGGLLAAPALYTQAAADPQEGGMMGEGGPMMGGDMRGMMAHMQEMMANCSRMMQMMQTHMQDHGHGGPTEQGRMPRNEEAPGLPPVSPESGG